MGCRKKIDGIMMNTEIETSDKMHHKIIKQHHNLFFKEIVIWAAFLFLLLCLFDALYCFKYLKYLNTSKNLKLCKCSIYILQILLNLCTDLWP